MQVNKIVIVRKIAICWLVFLFAFFLGLYVYDAKVWPYRLLKNIKHFVAGDVAENKTLWEKIENDSDLKPSRHISHFPKVNGFGNKEFKELKGLTLNPRRENPQFFLSDKAPDGYRLIFGVFDFEKTLHGAVLLDHRGRVVHVWHISQEGLEWEHSMDTNVFPHGFEIAPDGSIVTVYDGGTSITKYDYCGNVLWRTRGGFHHSIAFEGDEAIWTWGSSETSTLGYSLVKIDYHTGDVIKEIALQAVMDANSEIDIFGIRQVDTKDGSTWANDKWHPNDIDPLPKNIEQYYPKFKTGDLLVCLRSLNLIFVMDQVSLEVKWWRQGLTRRPHDPDWNSNGTITIFNNNMHRGFANIVELNPTTYEYDIVIDGQKYNFSTWYRGKHEMIPSGGALITSPNQGRVFETDMHGNIVFEFINTYGTEDEVLSISEARFLPNNFFKELAQCE